MSKKQLTILLVILAVVIISAVIWLVWLKSIKPINQNQNVNQVNINQSIDKEIYFELGEKFWLKENQTAILKNDDLKIKLKKITYSPCREGARCVWSGLAASIEVSKEAQSKELGLVLSEDVTVYRFNIELTDVQSDKVSFVVNESKEVTISTDKISYQKGEEVKITVDNNSGEEVDINYPFYEIRKAGYSKGEGEIEIVRCPCGSKCSMAAYITLKNGEKEEFTWNQANQRCEGNKQINEQVPTGTYRVESYLKNEEENKKLIYTEFTIMEQLTCGGFGNIQCTDGYFCYIAEQTGDVITSDPMGVCKLTKDYEDKCCKECYDNLLHDPRAVGSEAIDCIGYNIGYKDGSNYYGLSDECIYYFKKYPHKAAECEISGTNNKFITSYIGEYKKAKNASQYVRDELILSSINVNLPLDEEEVCILAKEACGSDNCNNITQSGSIWSVELNPVCGVTSAIIDEENKSMGCYCWFVS